MVIGLIENRRVWSRRASLGWVLVAAWCHSATGDVQQPPAADEPQGFIREAPLPQGFPPPGPVGVVVEKRYPASRTFWARGEHAFALCFAFLKAQSLEMTAPVVLDQPDGQLADGERAEGDAAANGDSPLASRRMHFVLESPQLTELGQWGPVTVQDMPAVRVASVSARGPMNLAAMKRCERTVRQYIADRPSLQAAGPLRVLGYNSPQVPADRRFWEVQVPIESRGE